MLSCIIYNNSPVVTFTQVLKIGVLPVHTVKTTPIVWSVTWMVTFWLGSGKSNLVVKGFGKWFRWEKEKTLISDRKWETNHALWRWTNTPTSLNAYLLETLTSFAECYSSSTPNKDTGGQFWARSHLQLLPLHSLSIAPLPLRAELQGVVVKMLRLFKPSYFHNGSNPGVITRPFFIWMMELEKGRHSQFILNSNKNKAATATGAPGVKHCRSTNLSPLVN